ncbi:MAG: LysM peptidoglycan-binding domain-containing protein [Anaerolineales bacterium]|nr:MAG: LysM peptidoglycan-binding domain-containing protein [Anaerolineales bacterium]
MKINTPQSRKKLLFLGAISLIVLAGAGVLGGFLAVALTASLNNQPPAPLETVQVLPSTQPVPRATATAHTESTSIRPTSTPMSPPTPTLEPTTFGLSSTPVTDTNATPIVSTTLPVLSFFEGPLLITMSVQGRPLHAYRFGTGPSSRAIIGAIHGGYEWNTTTLISRTMSLLLENPQWVPSNVTLYVIPIMNPDGYAAGTDAVVARMNGNLVDLNRNWDYQWQMTATHGTRPVKAGTAPFSEPETRGIRDFISQKKIEAVIFYHSALGVVFHGANSESSQTYPLTQMLSDATGYPIQESIPGQITTGDAIDYLSEVGVAGTEIELTSHAEVNENEFQRNINGLKAFLLWVPEIVTATVASDVTIGARVWVTYTIQEGDMLSSLALKYSTTVEQLQNINGLSDEDVLYVGGEILVPKSNE